MMQNIEEFGQERSMLKDVDNYELFRPPLMP